MLSATNLATVLVLLQRPSFSEGQFPEKLVISQISARECASRLGTPSRYESLPPRKSVLKIDKPVAPAKTAKSRVSRAMKARARLRLQHRMRSLSVARNK